MIIKVKQTGDINTFEVKVGGQGSANNLAESDKLHRNIQISLTNLSNGLIDFVPMLQKDMKGKVIDAFEVHPCKVVDEDKSMEPKMQCVEQCEPEEAEFWSVYIHYKDGGLDCIADCNSKAKAESVVDFLTDLITRFKPE